MYVLGDIMPWFWRLSLQLLDVTDTTETTDETKSWDNSQKEGDRQH